MHKAVKEDIVPVKDRFGNQDPPGTRIVFVEKKRSKPKTNPHCVHRALSFRAPGAGRRRRAGSIV
jgi:hypothetical protein